MLNNIDKRDSLLDTSQKEFNTSIFLEAKKTINRKQIVTSEHDKPNSNEKEIAKPPLHSNRQNYNTNRFKMPFRTH